MAISQINMAIVQGIVQGSMAIIDGSIAIIQGSTAIVNIAIS